MHTQNNDAVALGLEFVRAHKGGDCGDQRRRGDVALRLRRAGVFAVAALCQRLPRPEVRLKEHDEQGTGRSCRWFGGETRKGVSERRAAAALVFFPPRSVLPSSSFFLLLTFIVLDDHLG